MAVENLVSFVQNFFGMLPVILQTVQIIFYVVLILFFGKIAVKGFRAKMNPLIRYIIIIFTGTLCLAASMGLAWVFSFAQIEAFRFLQIEILLAGLVSSLVFALGFYFLTHNMRKSEGLQEIWEEIDKIKDALVKKKILKTISEKEAKKKAEDATEGKAKKAELLEDVWKVDIEKNKKHIVAFIDAFNGDVKEILYHSSRVVNFFSDKFKIFGLLIVILFTVVVLANYKGLPDINDTLSEMGLSPEIIGSLSGVRSQGSQEDCVSLYTVTKEVSRKKPEIYTGSDIKNLIESESSSEVISMSKMDYENKTFVFAITENNQMCYTQDGKFCGCFEI
jgi:hypothetical protein